ncbi:hypothetical protein MS2017_1351 [Bathymodiolus thermophilus thioautotrophic gill symbiont]|uniref:Uncharacterized protein n=1 Tax=Bathymodiolus thermophilus thioautotrophic gill symbiont TaxID=2360 RepID=A0A3G3IMM9_9GAMM|nr:hypothetical protein [Bathymodiolus thermophilus thioautotrophic gill symbiont]AYQ57041.1 hypothetical protein MS2017_1351 [Bathymodiolus thermophilus thioautotrophic gill symbiont]
MLSVKKPTSKSKDIAEKMREKAVRISYLTDGEMKKLKIKSIVTETKISTLLDTHLAKVMKNKSIKFQKIKAGAEKRSFAINKKRLEEMKIFLIEQEGITQDILIYNAILMIIK